MTTAERVYADGPCPLCGGASAGPAFPYSTCWNDRRYRYVGCRQCGSTYVTPLPGAADFDRMYDRSVYHDIHYAGTEETAELQASLAFLGRGAAPGARLLDFGCGAGTFLRAAARQGYTCEGVEQGDTSIALARQNSGAEVRRLEEVERHEARFDVIHVADVLEHLPNPAATLRRLEARLAHGGRFFIEGPLEKQRSLVYLFAAGVKGARRRLGADREGDGAPYHLTSTSWTSQLYFFERVMGYGCEEAELYETAWPYPARVESGASLGGRLRGLVGSAAVRSAATGWGKRIGLANRFRAIVKPPLDHSRSG